MDKPQLNQVSNDSLDKLLGDKEKPELPKYKNKFIEEESQLPSEELTFGKDKISKLLNNKKLIIESFYLYQIKDKLRYYHSLIIKHKVFSSHQQPIIFESKIIYLAIKLANELNGRIVRSDKAIKQLIKLGFNSNNKVLIIKYKTHKIRSKK